MKVSSALKWFLSPLVLAVAIIPSPGWTQGKTTTLTVIPFVSKDGEDKAWLSKGIADLLMRNLSVVDNIAVLERDHLQAFLREMELGELGFSKQSALRVASIAKVEQVIYGNYRIEEDKITINLIVVDLASQRKIQRESISGPLEELHSVTLSLTQRFLHRRQAPLSAKSETELQELPAYSISATKRFYRGLDHYDRGEYPRAFGLFWAASRQDPVFWDAYLWMGKMLEHLGHDRLAISAYQKLQELAPDQVEGLDAMLLSGMLLEKTDTASAADTYRLLAAKRPVAPRTLEAAFRLGTILKRDGHYTEAFRAFRQVDEFRNRLQDTRPKNTPTQTLVGLAKKTYPSRASRFFGWRHALDLYRGAIVQMASIYPDIAMTAAGVKTPKPPRGVYLIDPAAPTISEERYGEKPPLFHEGQTGANWRETLYAVAVPKGYLATGADLEISGRSLEVRSAHSYTMRVLPFPLPRNYQNDWLGVIYGQTAKPTRLRKYVPFYGRRESILTLQFIENHSRIHDWRLTLHLVPDQNSSRTTSPDSSDPTPERFHEGVLAGRIPISDKVFSGISQPLAHYWYLPRQTLALANRHRRGFYLVTVRGQLGGEQTDLWVTHSLDGRRWTKIEPATVNSLSEDFAPRLVNAEDGSLHLFWISNRRGLGWELWTSRIKAQGKRWSSPSRIPLEQFAEVDPSVDVKLAERLLHFAVAQDRQGRWIIVHHSVPERKLIVLTAYDTKDWQRTAKIPTEVRPFNPAIVEDAAGVYQLAAMGSDGDLHLWRSNNLSDWRHQSHNVNYYRYPQAAALHGTQLFGQPSGKLLLLMSDASYGLQYTRFNPDTDIPSLDLVKDAGLGAYAATATPDGRYLLALQGNRSIELRRYRDFASPLNGENPRHSILYSETTQDPRGNRWRRIFARSRNILPDVTTVGAAANGRVWWGIETGVMGLKGQDFFAADVADGFFNHYVTDIVPCGASTAFVSKSLNRPVIGIATPTSASRRFALSNRRLDVKGRITAITCAGQTKLYVGTSSGELLSLAAFQVLERSDLGNASISAVAYDHVNDEIWVGTETGDLLRVTDNIQSFGLPVDVAQPDRIHALALDQHSTLWVSIGEYGVFRLVNGVWERLSQDDDGLPYSSVSHIVSDPNSGVWMVPTPELDSVGLIHVDGSEITRYNPPHHTLHAPTGLAVTPNGDVWIGTAARGLFQLQRHVQ